MDFNRLLNENVCVEMKKMFRLISENFMDKVYYFMLNNGEPAVMMKGIMITIITTTVLHNNLNAV